MKFLARIKMWMQFWQPKQILSSRLPGLSNSSVSKADTTTPLFVQPFYGVPVCLDIEMTDYHTFIGARDCTGAICRYCGVIATSVQASSPACQFDDEWYGELLTDFLLADSKWIPGTSLDDCIKIAMEYQLHQDVMVTMCMNVHHMVGFTEMTAQHDRITSYGLFYVYHSPFGEIVLAVHNSMGVFVTPWNKRG